MQKNFTSLVLNKASKVRGLPPEYMQRYKKIEMFFTTSANYLTSTDMDYDVDIS